MKAKKVLFLVSVCMIISLAACQRSKDAEVVPVFNVAPTPTLIPSPSPVVLQTASITPIPTEKSSLLEFTDIQVDDLKIREFVTDAQEMEIAYAYGNVMVIYSAGKYGALDYNGNLLVENIYEEIWVRPNGDGDFALGNKEKAVVFNAQGDRLLEIAAPDEMFINERVVTYIVYKDGDFGNGYAYNLERGRYIATFEASYVSVMSEGKFYFSDRFGLVAMDVDGNSQMIWDYWNLYDGKERIIPLLFEGMRDGYGTVSCICTAGYHMGLISEDGQELLLISPDELAQYSKFGSYDRCGIFTYQEEGVRYANLDKKIVVYLESDDKERFFLIDFARAEKNQKRSGTTYLQENTASNFSEMVVGEYDSICMSPSGNHAATKDGGHLYFNNAGVVLGEYKQNLYFRRNHGLIMEENNDVYLINSKGKKMYGGISADTITIAGNAFGVKKDNRRIYWLVVDDKVTGSENK